MPAWLLEQLWERDIKLRPRWQRVVVHIARMVYGVARKFVDNQLSMRAMSLVYTTLLSLVPLLAVSFAVLRAFGVHNQIEPTLLELLEPLGEKRFQIAQQIVEFVENLRLGVLSSLGMVMLIYTIVAMTHKVEQAFNDVWHVSQPRGWLRRFSDYLSVILIGPVLVFSVLSITRMALHSSVVQWFVSIEILGTLLYGVGRLVPYLVVCAAFAFVYGFIPNTRIKFTTAIVGGIFTGILWSAASVVFANLVVDSSNYSAIYAGFASVVLFMVWTYLGWMIVLVGAQFTFYWQNTRFLDPRLEGSGLSNCEREGLALELMTLIGRAYHDPHESLWTREDFERIRPGIQPIYLHSLLDTLREDGYVITSSAEPAEYLPARAIGGITVREVIRSVRGEDAIGNSVTSVGSLMADIDNAMESAIGERTIEDLIVAADHAPRPHAVAKTG